jgi:hypothetical protein
MVPAAIEYSGWQGSNRIIGNGRVGCFNNIVMSLNILRPSGHPWYLQRICKYYSFLKPDSQKQRLLAQVHLVNAKRVNGQPSSR